MENTITIAIGTPGPLELGMALGVTLGVFLISGLVWFLTKFLAKAAAIVVPILCGFVAVAVGRPAGALVVLVVGVLITTPCLLYGSIFDLERRVKALTKD
ncbi:hypothetical protein ACFLQU_02915 [Verrucomicrobiota bacterium]